MPRSWHGSCGKVHGSLLGVGPGLLLGWHMDGKPVRHMDGKPMESRVGVWTDFKGGRKRGSGKAETLISSMNIIHVALLCMAPPYEIQRSYIWG